MVIEELVEEISPNADKSTQTIHSVQMESETMLLRSELRDVKAENSRLRKQRFSFVCIQHDESLVKYFTGISTAAFQIICELVSSTDYKYFYGWKPVNLTLQDQILMTLMKLRLNLGYTDLRVRFQVSKHTVGNIILTFIHLMHEILFQCGMEGNIPSVAKNLSSLPKCFANYKNCRIVIDCTEIRSEVPSRLDEQKDTYSSYKHGNTLKGLIGIAPNGTITYASKLYPGSSSDKSIVSSCGILKYLKTGDLILADKGFLLKDVLPDGVDINVPPFLETAQFTQSEVEQTRSIAKARIHVERAIARLKCYRILQFIPKKLYRHSSKVFQLCAALTNYQNPLISEVGNTFTTSPNDVTQLDDEALTEEEDEVM